MIDLLPCPMCGSSASLDSTGAVECYGWDWQTVSIECNDTNGKMCGMELSLSADFYTIRNSEEVLSKAWNSLDRK